MKRTFILLLIASFIISCNNVNKKSSNLYTNNSNEFNKDSIPKSMEVSFLNIKLGDSKDLLIEQMTMQNIDLDMSIYEMYSAEEVIFENECYSDLMFSFDDNDKVKEIYAASEEIYKGKDYGFAAYKRICDSFRAKYGIYETRDDENYDITNNYEMLCPNTLEYTLFRDEKTEVSIEFIYFKTKNKKSPGLIDGWCLDHWFTRIYIQYLEQ